MRAFYETRDLFRTYIDYTEPLSYEEWLAVADDAKAAVLYVQFFDQITLAWTKTKSLYTPAEDGVETMMQYLVKNVPILVNDPKRFTAKYIYRVAYNCLYCICHDIQRDKDRFENETSNIIICGEDEVDLFDGVFTDLHEDVILSELYREKFWAVIESMQEDDAIVVINRLLGSDMPAVTFKPRLNAKGEVVGKRKVVITEERQTEIIKELRRRLRPLKVTCFDNK